MRTLLTTLGIGLGAALMSSPPAASQDKTAGTDLLARDLRDWSRFGSGKSPWRVTSDRILVCRAANDTLMPEREFADGTLRFEYRFLPTAEKTGYKAAVWARRTLEGSGCKVALGDDCGNLSASFQGSSDRVKTVSQKAPEKLARPIGSWNQVKLTLSGRSVTATINGKQASSFAQCNTRKGLIALEVEGSEIEFRNVMWKEGLEPVPAGE